MGVHYDGPGPASLCRSKVLAGPTSQISPRLPSGGLPNAYGSIVDHSIRNVPNHSTGPTYAPSSAS